jgi:hypothetical protein
MLEGLIKMSLNPQQLNECIAYIISINDFLTNQ